MKRYLWLLTFATAGFGESASDRPVWSTDINVRGRIESREQNFTFDSSQSSPTDASWLLSRARIGLKRQLDGENIFYAQLQDAREFGSDRPSVPYILGSEGDDPMDLRQLYCEHRTSELSVRVGRQLLAFGDERLVGPVEWNNFARSFDAARLTWPKIGGGVDAFVSSVVQVQPGGKTGWHSNHASSDDIFAGVYSRFTATNTLKVEPYVLWRGKRTDTAYSFAGVGSARPYDIPQRVVTTGLRWIGSPSEKLQGFDYDGEFAWQTGEVRGRQQVGSIFGFPGPAWLNHNAWAIHTAVGYTSKALGFPARIYGELNHATGDRNPSDSSDQSFLNLFPTNHKFYGAMDVFAWKNITEIVMGAAATLNSKTKLRLDYHLFSLANTNDTWFRANAVTPVRTLTPAARAASRHAGQEADVVFSRAIGSHYTLEVGASYFAAGRYLDQTGGASDARFIYLQLVFQQ